MIFLQMRVSVKMSSMELIKKLRDTTGSGIVDCKKALSENSNDIEASIKWLREKDCHLPLISSVSGNLISYITSDCCY